ncbi:hypothetical protein Pse7367_2469 [Thalassoporum mexicanum PCC 7367]|uniref:cytochrome b6f subunit PetP n=1 Tax=Thalassoporum mexicanum TaxID=3457544 RepID=UPI00029FA526|nr:DUF2862 domain-containing protein [Pseudanabaena sp. PCC 7367]AFY70729.1 hypothetical protein Pse7367_2469 [Pseudanabaena sp. PCC 7367]
MQSSNSFKIGQRVRIQGFREGVNQDMASKQGEVGTIAEPKIVDGGMGYVVEFNDSQSAWFFAEELEVAG